MPKPGLLLVGIDSLDPHVLQNYAAELPVFARLAASSPTFISQSVFPVDSIPAWMTIYTGMSPGRHGVVKAYDVFDANLADILSLDYSRLLKGNTFWDIAGSSGKKIRAIFPFLAFPPWATNGIMLSKSISEKPVPEGDVWETQREVQAFPESALDAFSVPRLLRGVSGKHPGPRNLFRWAQQAKAALQQEAQIGLRCCQDGDWDLFFIYFSWLDIIQHRLWRYFDTGDPAYLASGRLHPLVLEFYRAADKIVGDFLSLFPAAQAIVFSDHGHGIRPAKSVNLNKVLRDKGLYFAGDAGTGISHYIQEKLKNALLSLAQRLNLDYWLVDLSTRTPALSRLSKQVYASGSSSHRSSYLAHLSAFCGVKSYSHGGVEIERANLPQGRQYEQVRESIISCLEQLEDPSGQEKLFAWVCTREELYEGDKVAEVYPDIVFELRESFGTGWNLHSGLFGKSYDHNLASGGHKKEAVFLLNNVAREVRKETVELVDIAPTILDLLSVPPDRKFDGRTIFKMS